ncbi:MAG TPA: hypothetical protein VGX76_14110 [Pirellulales bacterium]|nr:hypothetical protein [Pirellulales bacterium]
MTVILGATASDTDSVHACDHAAIELTPELARKILARIDTVTAAHRADSSTHELHFWDCEATFFQRTDDDDLDERIPDDASAYLEMEEPVSLADEALLWTEYTHMVVAVNGVEPEVYWLALSKHVPVRMQTAALPQSFVEQVARGGASMPSMNAT